MFSRFAVYLACVALGACHFVVSASLPFSDEREQMVRIAFGSCINDPNSPIWDAIRDAEPDLFLVLGDSVYLEQQEFGREDLIAERYRRLFDNRAFRDLRRHVPTYAIWDDHDSGPDNGDSAFRELDLSRQVFQRYWKRTGMFSDEAFQANPGDIAHRLLVKEIPILLTDDRSYRQNPSGRNSGTTYGEKQLAWIRSELSAAKAPLVILASGQQILSEPGGHETLADFPHEQAELFEAIGRSSAPVVILSGDRHFAEILEREVEGKNVVEISSSPLTAEVAPPGKATFDPSRKSMVLQENNFGMLSIDLTTSPPELLIEIRDSHGLPLLSYRP